MTMAPGTMVSTPAAASVAQSMPDALTVRVIVATMQFPLYLFKDEHGQWTGLNSDLLKRISDMTGLQFVYQESFSTDQMLAHLESGAADLSTTLAMNDERKEWLSRSPDEVLSKSLFLPILN